MWLDSKAGVQVRSLLAILTLLMRDVGASSAGGSSITRPLGLSGHGLFGRTPLWLITKEPCQPATLKRGIASPTMDDVRHFRLGDHMVKTTRLIMLRSARFRIQSRAEQSKSAK
jgi:hypothetical protein